MKIQAPTWDEIYELGLLLAEKVVGKFHFDAIVGVSRGGLITARILSDLLEVKDIVIIKSEHYHGIDVLKDVSVEEAIIPDLSKQSVLVTDDIADTGDSLNKISELLVPKIQKLKTLCLFKKNSSNFTPDFYQAETDAWIIFPWERLEAIKALEIRGIKMKDITKAGISENIFRRLRTLTTTTQG